MNTLIGNIGTYLNSQALEKVEKGKGKSKSYDQRATKTTLRSAVADEAQSMPQNFWKRNAVPLGCDNGELQVGSPQKGLKIARKKVLTFDYR